jgi:deoxyribose-phosphate aldolase
MGIKASAGIRDGEFALKLRKAGATRIGTSTGVKIAEDCAKKNDSCL